MDANEIYNPNYMHEKDNDIHPTAIIYPNVFMGKGNKVGPYTVIGSPGEIRGTANQEFAGSVYIGDNNVISEMVTIQKPLEAGKFTAIGSNNILMAHSHIGHDAQIENNTEICTGSIIGGYAWVRNGAKIKLQCVVRNRIKIGENAIVGMGSVVVKDVQDNQVVFGNPAKPRE